MEFQAVRRTGGPGKLPGVAMAAAAAAAGSGEHATRHTLLSMYAQPPCEDISLDEFERLALERLRVLKGIEDLRLRGKENADLFAKIRELTDKHLKGANNQETARLDQTSHYILRLAYCGRPELRKWLLAQECELFRARFLSLLESAGDRAAFMARERLNYAPVPASELTTALRESLRRVQLATGVSDKEAAGDGAGMSVFKVPFTSVPDLVAQRKVYLKDGFAYVWQRDLASLVVQDFRSILSRGLASVNRRWREIFPDSDARLRPLVEGLSTRYLGPDLGATSTASRRSDLTVANLPQVSARHFPLCAQHLMNALHRDHHMRHGGRQQLTLFLKSIGLPLEEAMVFWRSEFAPRVPSDKFEKEYAYNIRHNYGKEGKMADYSAHNCVTVIRSSGGPDDHHGCPYRRMDEASLRTQLAGLRCDGAKVDEAMAKKAGGHFQLACACVFEGMHRGEAAETGINHPAQYYLESRRVHDVWAEAKGEAAAAKAGAPGAAAAPGAALAGTAAPTRSPLSPLVGAGGASRGGAGGTPR